MFPIIIQTEQRQYGLLTCFTATIAVFLKLHTVIIFIPIFFLSSKSIAETCCTDILVALQPSANYDATP